jgi:uncharacterized protein
VIEVAGRKPRQCGQEPSCMEEIVCRGRAKAKKAQKSAHRRESRCDRGVVVEETKEADVRVAELWIHPVKSLGAIAVQGIEVDPIGPRFDRRWMVVDEAGRFRTQRDLPTMALVRTGIEGDTLVMSADGAGKVGVPVEPGEEGAVREVVVWNDTVHAIEPSAEASAWISRVLGAPSTLVALPPSSVRAIEAKYAEPVRPGARVGFADGFPFLVANRSSLAELRRDPVQANKVYFGVNAIHEGAGGSIRVGDAVEVAG